MPRITSSRRTRGRAVSRNPKLVRSRSAGNRPYGAIDGWTNCAQDQLQSKPYDDKEIRWALNYAMNRKQIIDVGFKGSGDIHRAPLPAYPV